MADQPFLLKEEAYPEAFIQDIAHALHQAHSPFDEGAFIKNTLTGKWEQLELKDRMHHLADQLNHSLALPYHEQLAIFRKVIQIWPENSLGKMCFPDFVERHGMTHPKESLAALADFTEYASAEFAVRPFLIQYPEQTMAAFHEWSRDENEHRRRLASEGCRPRLPWAMALPAFKQDPAPVLPILERLKADPSEYVRRSVANNLNDISKDHPELVLQLATDWYGQHPDTDRLVKHALRTLLKAGNSRAMQLFGFATPEAVRQLNLKLPPSVQIGNTLIFDLQFELGKPGLLRLEYRVDYLKKNGKHSGKVFMLSEKQFEAGTHHIQRKQHFRNLSTRKHYPGLHQLHVVVNGVVMASEEFEVVV